MQCLCRFAFHCGISSYLQMKDKLHQIEYKPENIFTVETCSTPGKRSWSLGLESKEGNT